MAVTLADAKLLTQDKLTMDVIDEFRRDELLDLMIFDNCVALNGGSTLAYTYNRVLTPSGAAFRNINSDYTASEANTKHYTTYLKIFGGSFGIDRVIQKNVKGITNQLAFQLEQKIKAARTLFSDTLINGDASSDAKVFDGLDVAVTGTSTEITPSAVINLDTSANIDANYKVFLDNMEDFLAELDGTPTMLIMNRKMRSAFNKVGRRTVAYQETRDEFGRPIATYDGIRLVTVGDKNGTTNPIIANDSVNGTSIYAVRVGLDGVCGITPEGDSIIDVYMPDFNAAGGAVKTGEVEMVAGLAVKATRSAGVLRKIKVA